MKLRRTLRRHFSARRPRWVDRLQLLLAGGRWSANVPPLARTNLRRLILSGVLDNISDAIVNTYQAVYLVALGATRAEIGLLSSLSNVTMPVGSLPGGRLAARQRRYKRLVALPSLLGRLLLLGLVLLPSFDLPIQTLVYLAMAFAVGRALLLNLSNPARTVLLSKAVPLRWRGRYFSARNIFMGGGAFVALLLIGRGIDLLGSPLGYQAALGGAVLAALGSAAILARFQEEPAERAAEKPIGTGDFLRNLRRRKAFVRLCAVSTLWSFGVNIASPFFIIFLAEQVQAPAATLGLVSAASTLSALPGQRLFGGWLDRKGTAWVKRLTGFLIPIVPALWGFMQRPWQAYPLQLFSGFVWAGYNLATFNFLLEMTPDENRPRYVAFQQSLVGLGMAAGAALGGWIAQSWGYTPVFLISAAGRLLASAVFALGIAEVNPVRRTRRALSQRLDAISRRRKRRKTTPPRAETSPTEPTRSDEDGKI